MQRLSKAGCLGLLLGLTASLQAADIKTGLKAYWNFDQKNFDDAVGIFDGTPEGDAPIEFVSGKGGFGQAIKLLGPAGGGGANQSIEITGGEPDDLAFADGSVSVSLWFTVEAWDVSWQAVAAKGEGNNWRIHRRGGANVMGFTGGAGGDTPAGSKEVNDGQWHHLVAISDSTTLTSSLYIDGELDATRDIGALTANGLRMRIGENPAARGRYWHGLVDDVAIWDRPLTPAEITSLHAGGAGKPLSSFFAPPNDADKDGMPDEWETQYGFNPNDPADAALDANANGITNLDEFKQGFDPRDTVRPAIRTATTTGTFDTVVLTFNKNLDPATAGTIANYVFSPALAVTEATVKGAVVTLKTAAQTPGATAYTVTVSNVKSFNSLTVAANTRGKFYSFLMTKSGVMKFSHWNDIPGTPVDNLYADPRYPASPTGTGTLYSFSSRDFFPGDALNNYGAVIEGLLTPTEAGSYRFFIHSDDASQLFLSTDDKEAGLVQIAEEPNCCQNFSEPEAATRGQTSEPIPLVAGKSYLIRLVYKEGGGGDYGRVAWRKEGDTTPAGSLTPIPGKFLSSTTELPFPSEGAFSGQTPAANAKNVAPNTAIGLTHIDGKTVWGTNNVTVQFNGTTITPTPLVKDGAVATIRFTPPALLPSKTRHTVAVIYRDAGNALATNLWSFETTPYQGPILDAVKGYAGLMFGTAATTDDMGGRSGAAGDRALRLPAGGGSVNVLDASWFNAAAAKDTVTVAFWQKNTLRASSSFWFNSPTSNNGTRGFQAHVPWSDGSIYFDSAGCCTADTQRINANIDTFGGYSGEPTWWNSWHHYAFVKNGETKEIYIDGQLFHSGGGAPLPTDITNLIIGGGSGINDNRLDGTMDDFAVYGAALTAAQIDSLAKGTAPGAVSGNPGLIAHWNFNTPVGAPPTVNEGLVAYWDFDGDLQDAVKDFHGTARGTAPIPFVDGLAGFGKSIKLDGADQFVEITGGNENELEFPAGSMSISGWFKVGAFDTDWQALISKGEGSNYRVARRGGGNAVAYAGGVGEGADTVPSVNDGRWHHFVAVSDASGVPFGTALYVDGVLLAIQATKPVLTGNARNLFIGENPDARNREWEGELDDIGIWNRVLKPEEVAAIWNAGAGRPLSAFPMPPKAARVLVELTGGNVKITFTGTLQSADNVAGPWTDVAGATTPYTTPSTAAQKYFRSRN